MYIAADLVIDERHISEKFVRSSGPGGQHVNRVATAVELRFDAAGCSALAPDVRARLMSRAGQRATRDGEIVIRAERFRSQERNRADARRRLADLILRALRKPKKRRPTKPSKAARTRRLDAKARRGALKRLRQHKPGSGEI